jgi:hypothetical protein
MASPSLSVGVSVRKRMSGLCVVSSGIMSVLDGLWRPVFCVLCDEGDVLCNGRGCLADYRLHVCRLTCGFGVCGGSGW